MYMYGIIMASHGMGRDTRNVVFKRNNLVVKYFLFEVWSFSKQVLPGYSHKFIPVGMLILLFFR